jgi:hypothetical protein
VTVGPFAPAGSESGFLARGRETVPFMYSPDGKWWWNGSNWVPVAAPPVQALEPGSASHRFHGDTSCEQWMALILILVFGLGTLLMLAIAGLLFVNGQVVVALFTLGMGLFLVIPLAVGFWLAWRVLTKRAVS